MAKVFASVFSADILNMGADIERVAQAGVDGLHIDIMDGEFVPLFGFNNQWIQQIQAFCDLPLDVHIMSGAVEKIVRRLDLNRVKTVTAHLEIGTREDLLCLFRQLTPLRQKGIRCGLALSPCTDVELLAPYIDEIDGILVMSCRPGVQGAEFLSGTYGRIDRIRELVPDGKNVPISVDGGLDLEKAGRCIGCGAERVVIGRYLFKHPEPGAVIASLHEI